MAQKKQKKHAIYSAGYAQTLICAKNCTRDVHLLQALGAPPYQNPTLLQRTGYYGLLTGYANFFSFLSSDATVTMTRFPRCPPLPEASSFRWSQGAQYPTAAPDGRRGSLAP